MARNFQAVNLNYLQTPSPISGGPVTLACWVRRWTELNGLNIVVGLANSGSSSNHLFLAMPMSGVIMARKRNPTVTNAVSSGAVPLGQWAHAAAVFEAGNDFAAYLDGTDKGVASSSQQPTGLNALSVGRLAHATPGNYVENADVAEVGVWDVALTDAQIASLAAGAAPLLVQPDRLVAYQPLVRDVNWRRLGPAMADSGTTVAAHPPIIYPTSARPAPLAAADHGEPDPGDGPGLAAGAGIFHSSIIIPSRRVA